MIEDFRKLLDQVSEPLDLATVELLGSKGHEDLVELLKRDLQLFDSGIVDVENLAISIEETINAYRSRGRNPQNEDIESSREGKKPMSELLSPVPSARFKIERTSIDEKSRRPGEVNPDA